MIDPQLREEAPAVTAKTLRQFAALSVLVFGGLAAWQGLVRQHEVAGYILAALAVVLGVGGLARPEAIRPVFSLLIAVTTPIGRIVSLVVLAVLFYGLFTPIGLLFRVFGRDALQIKRRDRPTHWLQKPATTDPRSYLRQS